MQHETQLMTTVELASRVGVCPLTIRRWLRRGWLKGIVLPNGQYRVPMEELLRVLGGGHVRGQHQGGAD